MKTIPVNRVSVEPAIEPVTVDEVKANAFIVSDASSDSFITDQLIPAARKYVEKMANRSLITQTRIQYYDDLSEAMYLRYSPVQSVTSVTYKDSNENTQTLTSTLYTLDEKSYPARLNIGYDETYPQSICDTNSVAVTYVAGYGSTAATVPLLYRRAIILLCTHWYLNRGICMDADIESSIRDMLCIEGATLEYA